MLSRMTVIKKTVTTVGRIWINRVCQVDFKSLYYVLPVLKDIFFLERVKIYTLRYIIHMHVKGLSQFLHVYCYCCC